MQFEEGYIYHIYNQGNNRRKIFFKRENYLYFLQKIRTQILPYGDVLAWCLMPNHFHLMVYVREVELEKTQGKTHTMTQSHTHTMTQSHRMSASSRHPMSNNTQTLNQSIAIMLRSYTRAINIQEKTSGSLFRPHTKAECVNCPQGLQPSFVMIKGVTTYFNPDGSRDYPQSCFRYIHQNPVKAGLVAKATDWEYSSARDYAKLRKGSLVNCELTNRYIRSIQS